MWTRNFGRVIDTFAILRDCKAAVPIMARHHSGTIVNIGSIVGEISTPWNAFYLYCASKAAAHSISEGLSMELKPFNISVLHAAPAAVKSNISSNAINRFALAGSRYPLLQLPFIIRRIYSSQGPNSMPTKDFAQHIVSNALRKNPPRYMSIGRGSWLFAWLRWLPRGLVLAYMWRLYSS